MSAIKLLLIDSDSSKTEIDTNVLDLYGVAVHLAGYESLMELAIDFDVALICDYPSLSPHIVSQILAINVAIKVVVKIENSSARAIAFLQAGSTGVIDSWPDPAQLAKIIHLVLRGNYYLDQNIAQLLAMRQIKKILEPFVSLSSREFDVFCLLAEGCSLKSISDQLGINSKTVSNCQTLLKSKLSLTSKNAIKKLAKSHGLIFDKSV